MNRDPLRMTDATTTLPERTGYRIRGAQLQSDPYILVVGKREAAEGSVEVRPRSGGDQGASSLRGFFARGQQGIAMKGRLTPAAESLPGMSSKS